MVGLRNASSLNLSSTLSILTHIFIAYLNRKQKCEIKKEISRSSSFPLRYTECPGKAVVINKIKLFKKFLTGNVIQSLRLKVILYEI